jgi:hypothetical protein
MLGGMNKLPSAKRAQILTLLCEGSSMRTVSRVFRRGAPSHREGRRQRGPRDPVAS